MPLSRRAAALVVAAGVVAGVLFATAGVASAHALLLRTSPSPQSTVASAPAAIRLFFSETVEVRSGDVRVYDVDGKRVDRDKVTRRDGNREVDVAVPALAAGTYTVTWRAVSADTHAVRGGFVFYVGHPSAISPAAISGAAGASHALGFAYGVERFLWFASLSLLVGVVILRRWCWTPALRAAGLGDSDAAARFRRAFARLVLGAWTVLAVTGVSALLFQAATERGTSLLGVFGSSALADVLGGSYGRRWTVQLALTVLLFVPVTGLARRTRLLGAAPDVWIATGGLLVGGLCIVTGLQGHARTASRPVVAVLSIALHLFCAAVWAGGLAALVVVAVASWAALERAQRTAVVAGVVRRFSAIAMGAVIVIVVTGTVNSAFGFHAVADLWRDRYGRVVAAKVILLVLALALATRHRFVTRRRLVHADADETAAELRRFERLAGTELGVLVTALVFAAALVAMVPGRTTALAATGLVTQEHRAGSYRVQLLVDPARTGSNEVHVTFVGGTGLAAAEVVNAQVTLTPPGGAGATLDSQLIGPGHFVANATFPAPGRYRVDVVSQGTTSIFAFTVRKGD